MNIPDTQISRDQLTIRTSFGDALSGEFLPPTDPKHETHRLYRLAEGTVLDGTCVEAEEDQAVFEYVPAWASQATSTAVCAINSDGEHRVQSLMIRSNIGSYPDIDFHNGLIDHGWNEKGLVVVAGNVQCQFPLIERWQRNLASRYAASVAQEFFNSLVSR